VTFTFDTFTGLLFALAYLALLAICLAGMSAPQEWPEDENGNPIRGAKPKNRCPKHPGVAKCVCRGDNFGGRNRP
jgi:hypothetical protein